MDLLETIFFWAEKQNNLFGDYSNKIKLFKYGLKQLLITFRQWLRGWIQGSCVSEFMSYWPLVVTSNISAVLHRPRCQHTVYWTQLCSSLYWTVAKCGSPVWQSLQSTDLKRGRLKSQSHRADGRNSILRPVTFWKLAQVSSSWWDRPSAPHKQSSLFLLADKENRNRQAGFRESECMQGWREVTIDWREVESRKNKKGKWPREVKNSTMHCSAVSWRLRTSKVQK